MPPQFRLEQHASEWFVVLERTNIRLSIEDLEEWTLLMLEREQEGHLDLFQNGRATVLLPSDLLKIARAIPSTLLSPQFRERIASANDLQ